MSKSFSARLAALEALEAEQEAKRGRWLEVWLQIRPADYFALFEAEPIDHEACAAIEHAYGLDLINWDVDCVHVSGGTWPGVRRALEHTIARVEYDDGYGYWIDEVPWAPARAELGKPFWCVALDGVALAELRRAQRERALAAFNADFDLMLAALGDGRARVGATMHTWKNGVEIPSYSLWGMSDPDVCAAGIRVESLMREYGAAGLQTTEEYAAWIREHRQVEGE